jgi:hypothetical protein
MPWRKMGLHGDGLVSALYMRLLFPGDAIELEQLVSYNFKCHNGSPSAVNVSTPIPLLIERMSALAIFINPTARAFSFPSAIIATIVLTGMSPSIRATFDVSPGHLPD